jgi:hypothetical protein
VTQIPSFILAVFQSASSATNHSRLKATSHHPPESLSLQSWKPKVPVPDSKRFSSAQDFIDQMDSGVLNGDLITAIQKLSRKQLEEVAAILGLRSMPSDKPK